MLLVRMKTNDKNIFWRWFEVMTAGTADKVALHSYAEPSVLTHRSWCGDYTHTHACTWTASTQHMHPHTHATLTRTHAATHARNTHTHARNTHMHTRTHACTVAHTSTPHDQHTLSRSSAQPTRACAHIRPWQTHTQPGDSRARVRALSRLRKFVFIWPFAYVNWQVGPTRNMVNLTSQHSATQTIWSVNRVQSDAEWWASDRIITAKCI